MNRTSLPRLAIAASILAVAVDASAGSTTVTIGQRESIVVPIRKQTPSAVAIVGGKHLTVALPKTNANDAISASPEDAKVRERLSAGQTVTTNDIHFAFDSDQLMPEARRALNAIGQALTNDPTLHVLVRGHTDGRGTARYNMELSLLRAKAVREALTGWYGIAADRISVEGMGAAEPVATNETEEGQAMNRRVEFVPVHAGNDPAP